MAKKKTRRRRAPRAGCKLQNVKITSKRGKVLATFKAHRGPDCEPRYKNMGAREKKAMTAHLSQYQQRFALAASRCKREGAKGKSFGSCIGRKLRGRV